jgi:hypothetical protein
MLCSAEASHFLKDFAPILYQVHHIYPPAQEHVARWDFINVQTIKIVMFLPMPSSCNMEQSASELSTQVFRESECK